MLGVRKVSNFRVGSVSFTTYTKEEILQLSVLEVKTSRSFNALGHPTEGGVYDPKLGPTERNDLCGTCGQNSFHCPGHMGHIVLPVLTYNPVLFKTLFELLRGCCFSCGSLLAPVPLTLLLYCQLRALKLGLVNVALDMESVAGELLSNKDKDAPGLLQKKMDELLKEGTSGIDKEVLERPCVKNVLECRQGLIRAFVKEHFGRAVKKCPECQTFKSVLHNLDNNRIIQGTIAKRKMVVKTKKKTAKKRVEEDYDGEMLEEEEEPEAEKKGELEIPPGFQSILTPVTARDHVRKLWSKEKHLLQHLYPVLKTTTSECPVDIFFLECVPVPPSRFRPLTTMADKKFENPQSSLLSRVIQSCNVIKYILNVIKTSSDVKCPDDIQVVVNKMVGTTNTEKLQFAWVHLQTQINAVLDSDMLTYLSERGSIQGVKQLIEKKEGLFRKHMMGKRVNYAARSVISPDPYIGIDEIGIPEVFAKKLTYPQPVTVWNVKQLRQAVRNGPDIHPGASFIQTESGSMTKLSPNATQRDAMAKQLLTPSIQQGIRGCKLVHRHLKNGDVVLVNRQPTLHKSSIMAHRVRVLPGEKTIRLHYSNCKTYNADFDGDEMNIHFPQSELARAESYLIANVSNQYLVPKDGTPLGGLIQDHMVAGVRLSQRGRFFNREDYQQLVFSALVDKEGPIEILPPSILKPARLWSGKQVISTVLLNLTPENKSPINLEGKSKISSKHWQTYPARRWVAGGSPLNDSMSESEVIFRDGELLCGILDKAHYGPTPYGLIHCCYELYGGVVSGRILTALGRLFTCYLQTHGFTLGVEDILITAKADKKRRRVMKKASTVGDAAAGKALGVSNWSDPEELRRKLMEAHLSTDDRPMKMLDMVMKGETDGVNNDINDILMPKGLLKQFPDNNLQLMVQSGAKGSIVNAMQISCLLGQIELEGRRPPLTMSGRTLPSFIPYDTSPRAGGFVDGRFLTGIRPQEFFFHCMAGREGLIDTAVKTSRSGYLQRCLIKHLEGVVVNYDMTVRDSDGSVIQFLYGEDGIDILKVPFLTSEQFPFLARNYSSILNEREIEAVAKLRDTKPVDKAHKAIRKWQKKARKRNKLKSPFLSFSKDLSEMSYKEQVDAWYSLDEDQKKRHLKKAPKCPDPVTSKFRPDLYFGSVSERLEELIESYLSSRPYDANKDTDDDDDDDERESGSKIVSDSTFTKMMHQKIMRSYCEPGEAVGLLAAQSIGEPSTQMTLNTFHFAGRGEMNVTLGIPRMREILMTASSKIATPSMDIPFLRQGLDEADNLRISLNRVLLDQVTAYVNIHESFLIEERCYRLYRVKFTFLPLSEYEEQFQLTPAKILKYFELHFVRQILMALNRKFQVMHLSKLLSMATMKDKPVSANGDGNEMNDDDAQSSEEEHGGDDNAADSSLKAKHAQEREYEEPEYEEDNREGLSDDEGFEEDDKARNDEGDEMEIFDSSPSAKEESKKKLSKKDRKMDKLKRVEFVTNLHQWVSAYDYDVKGEEWCEITFKLTIEDSKIDLMSLLRSEARKAVVHEVANIKRAIITELKGCKILKTEGVNIQEMFCHDEILDLKHLYSNDIHAIAKTYGIEAAAKVIVKEIQSVFGVYGIAVDPRHLLLIADYMTFDGTYKPFNRIGLESSTSPLQQMSFETTMHFLKTATLSGLEDQLKSPSAQLVVGKMVGLGTGCFDVRQKLMT